MKKILSQVLVLIIVASSFFIGVSAQSTADTLEQTLYEGFLNCESEIYVLHLKIKWDDIDTVITPLLENFEHLHPEIFHLDGNFDYSGEYVAGEAYVTTIVPYYDRSKEEYKNQLYRFNAWLDEIAAKVDKDATDIEKVLFAHEYFVAHFEYDQTYSIYDAYNFLKYKTGVCQAYTLTFTALMQKFGIFCTSAIDGPDNHCWNIVKLGDNYYHIDVTHDDEIYTFNGCSMSDHCVRDHLLLRDETMKTLDKHKGGWYTVGGDYKCTDDSYENKIWADYTHPTVLCDNKWYQAECETVSNGVWTANIYSLLENGNKEIAFSFETPAWFYTGTEYLKFLDIYSVGNLIYGSSGKTIWRYNPKTGEFKSVFDLDNYICESAYMGGGKIRLIVYNDNGTLSIMDKYLLMGDTDDNGEVNTKDMVNLKKYLLLRTTEANEGFMDLNGDCFIDILDFIEIQKAIV